MKKLKVLFMGTPDFSVNVLQGLIDNYDVVGVVTQPDKEVGRKKEMKFSPVKELALKNDIRVYQPKNIKEEYEDLLKLNVDMIVTCAYGQIIPKILLDFPKYKCINVHASLLPKLRGGAPIHKAIINNYPRTGVTIMYMAEKMDAGDIISQVETPILKTDNVGTLHDRLSGLGTKLLLETIPNIISGNINPVKQNDEEVTYAWNISREEEKIDFNKDTIDIFNQIRGLNPWPGAYALLDGTVVKIYNSRISDSFFTTKKNGEIGKVYDDGIGISTHDGEIIITELQFAGKRRMTVKEYLNGKNKEDLIGKVFE